MITPIVRRPSSAQNGCICHAILNEGEILFQSITDIYIYIYIYMKVDKGAAKIKFFYPKKPFEKESLGG